mgnify:CR=1 FL=1
MYHEIWWILGYCKWFENDEKLFENDWQLSNDLKMIEDE